MTNKEKAIGLLKRYKLIKLRRNIICDKLTALENLITSARGVSCSATPSRDGSSKYEDKLVDYITQKDFCKVKLAKYNTEISAIDSALRELPKPELTALKYFFLDDDMRDRAGMLCDELGFERSHIYRIREKALNHLAKVYYARYA